MPAIKPDAPALLDAAIDYLERELLPSLAGYHRFQCRVTVNVLAQVRRELAARIRAGDIALDDPALLDHLRQSLVEALRINNPKWIGEPETSEPERG